MKKFFVVFCQKNLERPQIFKTLRTALNKRKDRPQLKLETFQSQLEAEKFIYPKKICYLMIQDKIYPQNKQTDFNEQLNEIAHKQTVNNIQKQQNSLEMQLESLAVQSSLEYTTKQAINQLYKEIYSYQGSTHFIKSQPMRRIQSDVKYFASFDGCSKGNPGKAGAGYVVFTKQNKIVLSNSVNLGHKTNNQAQFFSLIYLLLDCKYNKINNLKIYGDSQFVIKGIKNEYKIKANHLKYLDYLAKYLIKSFDSVSIDHIQRQKNKLADKLSNNGIKKKYLGKKGQE